MGASEWGKPPNALKGKRDRERRRRRNDPINHINNDSKSYCFIKVIMISA
jgi:hypothetical protein